MKNFYYQKIYYYFIQIEINTYSRISIFTIFVAEVYYLNSATIVDINVCVVIIIIK
jgi:hypothetical protein